MICAGPARAGGARCHRIDLPRPRCPITTSRIPGFYRLSTAERLDHIQTFGGLSDEDVHLLRGGDPSKLGKADRMIENVVGLFHLPVGFATNFRVDDADVLVPMVIEEPSVVAAASNAAKLLRRGAGIVTEATESLMIGQLQVLDVPDVPAAVAALKTASDALVAVANEGQPRLVSRGGGARSLSWRVLDDQGAYIVVHLLVDVCDAMGANLVNQMAECIAPRIAELSGGAVGLRILSNLCDHRRVSAIGRIEAERLARPDLGLTGARVAKRIEAASRFAEIDPYRAATHNKGIMNGVDAFLLATGQDWRAVEAGAHAFAARSGRYSALATWRYDEATDELVGRIDLPLQVGTVGGITRVHDVVRVLLKVLGNPRAAQLGRIAAAVGLAQNFAALQALTTEGIQRGHMSLHARNIAAVAGARPEQVDDVVAEMVRRRQFTHAAAAAILASSETTNAAAIDYGALVAFRGTWWPQVERAIAAVVPRNTRGGVAEMIWYHLDLGGKRIRATLPLLVCQALGSDPAEAVPYAAALELLHAGTLIHHELEHRVSHRRGGETIWVRYGREKAVSVGDALFFAALQCLDALPHEAERVRRLTSMVVRHMAGMAGAQLRAQGLAGDRPITFEGRVALERHRTGGLLALAFAGPAHLVGLPTSEREWLQSVGQELGVLMMLQEDLLDLLGGRFGSKPGQGISAGRVGLVVAAGLDRDRTAVTAALAAARGGNEAAVERAIDLLRSLGAMDEVAHRLQHQQERLANELKSWDSPLAPVLSGMASVLMRPLRRSLGGAVPTADEEVA
jgi:hydroxymethylglutaryl-CoA reductase